MKKLKLLFTVLFIAAAMMSCNLADWNTLTDVENDFDAISRSAIYRGGNASCDQLGTLGIEGLVQTTGRNNYNPTTDGFENGWPTGLAVMVSNDKSVSFQIDGSIDLGDGKCYKVGAVIVKGSDASNIYSYPGGTDHDINLLPPINSSGSPAGLSNLTFCFVECEIPPLVVAFKSYMTQDWACTSGGPSNISFVAYYNFVPNSSNKIYYLEDISKPVGNLMIGNFDNDNLMEVKIDNSDRTDLFFTNAFLFVGTLEDYNSLRNNYDQFYWAFPYKTGVISPSSSVTFDLPF